MGKIIMTGTDGNFGGFAARSILKKVPHDSLIFTAPSLDRIRDFTAMGIDCRTANYNDPGSLEAAFSGGETLMFISMPQVGENRRRMHVNAILAAVRAGVKRIVYTSIMGAGDLENCGYEIFDHRFTECFIKTQPLSYVFLRNSQYCEAMISAFEQAYEGGGVLSNNMGDGKMARISRLDCAEAAACVAAGAGENDTFYYITGAELQDMRQFTALGSEVTGHKVSYEYLTDEQCYAFFDAQGVPRETDGIWAEAAKAFPFCSKGMVTFGTAIRNGQMAYITDDFEKLTGKKAITVRQMFERATEFQIGARTPTDK